MNFRWKISSDHQVYDFYLLTSDEALRCLRCEFHFFLNLFSVKVTNKGTFLKTENFKFVDPSSQKSILDLNGASLHSIIGEFDGKSIQTDAIRTPRVFFF